MIKFLDHNWAFGLRLRFLFLKVARQSIFGYSALGKLKEEEEKKKSKVRSVVGGPESKFCLQVAGCAL